MQYYVYALKSKNFNWIYVGMTNNLERRLEEHNNKENISTKHYAPYFRFYFEQFESSIEARKREKYFKTSGGKTRLRKILETYEGGIDGPV